MDTNDIHDIIEGLDRQLAAGKIDLETYQTLTAKWQARLTTGAGPSISPTLSPAVEKVACPECSAPLDDNTRAPGEIVRCSFCRGTFTFKHAREQNEQIGQELRRWLDQVVVESVGGAAIDAAARRFIFAEKLYPTIQREYRRSLEPYEDAQEHPCTYLDLLEGVPGHRPADHVLLRNPDALPRVRALSLKVHSPLLANFAVAEEDRRQLSQVDFGTVRLVHLSNIANLLARPSADAYASARENLAALHRLYTQQGVAGSGSGAEDYLAIARNRFEAGSRVLEVLARVFSPDADFAAQVFLEELESAEELLTSARRTADTSIYNPLALGPLVTGLEREAQVLALLQALLHAYRTFGRGRHISFSEFYTDIKRLADLAGPKQRRVDQLIDLVNHARSAVQARRGMEVLHSFNRWDWAAGVVESGRQRGLLRSGETVTAEQRYWHPYWCAVISYSVARGTFVVSGVEQSGFVLADAAILNLPPNVITAEAPLHAAIGQAVQNYGSAGDLPVLLPSVPASDARRAALAAAGQAGNLRNDRVSALHLVHLPAVLAHYQSKAGGRAALYTQLGQRDAAGAHHLASISQVLDRYV